MRGSKRLTLRALMGRGIRDHTGIIRRGNYLIRVLGGAKSLRGFLPARDHCVRWARSARNLFWHWVAAERISPNSGIARRVVKSGSESIAGYEQ